ncbi:MAG: DMT family transporter [Rhodospirillales bacterium]|nr:DMT family transporter [Rhodospirillales bacterium]
MSRQAWAKTATLYGGLLWGTFWVPVRELDKAGIGGLWPVTLLYTMTWVVILPAMLWRWRYIQKGFWKQQVAGFFLGVAAAIYATAFLYTEVATAVLLYYLSPVWGFILARVVLGDPITPVRWFAMVLAIGGAAVILGDGDWPPVPGNIGDWLALSASVLFVTGSLMMLAWKEHSALDYGLAFFLWSGLTMLAATLILDGGVLDRGLPPLDSLLAEMNWLLPFVLLGMIPGCLAAIYGATVLNPGVVSIIFMSEIGVAVFLAAMLTDEPFGLRQIVGIVLIALAGVIESLLDWRRRRVAAA